MRRARGFTIIEVLVALVILNVGLLGLATTAAVVTRMIREGRTALLAASLVSTRFETLRASGCGAAAGSEVAEGVTLAWEVTAPAFPRARVLRIDVWRAGVGAARDSLATILLCP